MVRQGVPLGPAEFESEALLSLIIPAYNESERLAKTFPAVLSYMRRLNVEWEVIVVDDGSVDETAAEVREMAGSDPRVRVIVHETNGGKGKAVQTGMLAAKGAYAIFTDADMSTPIEFVKPFLQQLQGGCDIVIGNRRMAESRVEVRQAPVRELIGRLYTLASRLLLRTKISDQGCGFKGFSSRARVEVFTRQRIFGWAFDAEILHIADRLGFRICQFPVIWRHDLGSKVKVLVACAQATINLLTIWYNGIRGRYR